jgi:hypothetical protein
MNEQEEAIFFYEAPKIVPPEFRLYYDEKGHVVTYTCEKREGNYIVVDALTFAQARPDVRVIDGRISTVQPAMVITKLMPDTTHGTLCAEEDVSIVVQTNHAGKIQKWNLNIYELR